MPQIKCQVIFDGLNYKETRSITDDLPAEALGECVSAAVQKAWRNGVDPVNAIVLLTFE